MKFAFIAAKEVAFPVVAMCRVFGRLVEWLLRVEEAPGASHEDCRRAARGIADAHGRSRGIYGSPRVHRELKARGLRIGKKRVERLMRENGLRGRCRTSLRAHDRLQTRAPVAPNLLERYFDGRPRRTSAWVGDVTFIPTADGWLYLAVLLDLFSRRVVGWATSANERSRARSGRSRPSPP